MIFFLDPPAEADPGVRVASLTAQVESIAEMLWKRGAT
jgi:hypothetical protein